MCPNLETPKKVILYLEHMGNLLLIGVPIHKHITVTMVCDMTFYYWWENRDSNVSLTEKRPWFELRGPGFCGKC